MRVEVAVRGNAPPPVPIRTITVPDDGRQYMHLADDWETERWGYMPRSRFLNYKKDPPWNGLPATIPMQKLFFTLNREWQFFYLDLMRRATFDTMAEADLLKAYQNTTRDASGWRDRHTWNNVKDPVKVYTDYVLGLNVPPAFTYGDAAQQDLLASGNIVRVIGSSSGSAVLRLLSRTVVGVSNRALSRTTLSSESQSFWAGIREAVYDLGVATYTIETLDPFKPPPSVDEVWGKWWLIGWCTLSAYNWDTNQKARLKWPFFNGYGCPLMFLGRDGQNKVPKYWCKPIQGGTSLSLYYP